MIERATTCLENGGKQILRIPKTRFRAHRHLHSAFWSHGAGDIDLPAWWHAFLQVPSASPSKWLTNGDSRTIRSIAREDTDLGFLDFLYPVHTLDCIRKYVNENTTALRPHRRSQLPPPRTRTYTSSADDPVNRSVNHQKTAQNLGPAVATNNSSIAVGTVHPSEENLRARFHQLLYSEKQSVYTPNLWLLYEKMQELAIPTDPGDLTQLIICLGRSSSAFDVKKTRELFNSIALSDRTVIHYTRAITAALKEHDLAGAMAIQEEAFNRIHAPYGSSILEYTVLHTDWEAAVAVWQKYQNDKSMENAAIRVWKDVKTLPLSVLFRKVIKAVNFASRLDDAAPARDFAFDFARNVLGIRRRAFDQSLQAWLMGKVFRMQHPLTLELLENAMIQNFSMGIGSHEHSQAGLHLYAIVRTWPDFAPTPKLMEAVLRRCNRTRNSQGMYDLLNDYRRLYGVPPRPAYRLLMSQLARQGDFATVDQLFHESMARFGHGDEGDISDLAPQLLTACYRRAEVDRAVGVIDYLQKRYGYSPDLRVWNILLATYARVGDCDGAVALWKRLETKDLRPDSSSYGILVGMFAKRSDYEAANALYKQAVSEGVKPNVEMVSSLVMALATNDRLDEAQKIAEEAIETDLGAEQCQEETYPEPHTFTRMWNILLGQYAMKGQLDKVFDVQKRMHELGVAFDGLTYAALMQSLCIQKLPAAAQKILKSVMPKHAIRPTALHYAIVISGFVGLRNYPVIFSLQKRMAEDGIRPTFSTQNALLRLASQIDQRERALDKSKTDTFQAIRAESILSETIDSIDPTELATLGPTKFAQTNPPNIALQMSYFSYVIALYGRKKAFEKVTEIYNKYILTIGKADANLEADPPIEILSALMVSYNKAGEYDETKKCWQLALEKSKEIARKANADTSQPGWVLYKYRFILTLPLTRYMQSLQATSGVDELSAIIASLQRDGFQLSVHNWNKYVQVLVRDKDPVLAYEICEQQLMDGWPGWERFGHLRRLKRKIKKQWVPRSWELDRPFPHYETLVFLASARLDAQGLAYGAGREMLQEFERVAPRTVEAILRMPRIDDTIQNQLLKRD
ncbi:MAG: hypothetical protein LQ343_005172 [Gyalolechia ehrenbergii]|nr:MAG: hypothetical protein LQ343_005172 [Gyalolechia ehrenbergii]